MSKATVYTSYLRSSHSSWSAVKEQLLLFGTPTRGDLDFKGSDTQYGTHALHTYVAAMVPPLANSLVTNYVPKGEKVLDPFCGGGAVLVECVRNGRKAVGSDINPLATLISKVKSTYVDKQQIQRASKYVQAAFKSILNGAILFPPELNIEYWFLPHTISELSAIIGCIRECEVSERFSSDLIDILKVVFSATVRDVMLTYRNEVRLRRLEPTDLRRFKPKAFESFANRARLAIERIPALPKKARVKVGCNNVEELPFVDKEFHTIICSPPYGDERNGVSYLQFSKYMLYWLGYSRKEVLDARARTLGTSKEECALPSETVQTAFKLIEKRGGEKKEIGFYRDYFQGLREMTRVTREHVIIVIGNRILKQTVIENGKITAELMGSLGWKLYEHFIRSLPSKRLPRLRRESNHGFGGAIDREDILVFKPS